MSLTEPRIRPWSKEEYRKLLSLGWFDNQRLQLINGQIIEMPAPTPDHARAVSRLADVLRDEVGTRHWVRVRFPLNLPAGSEPEPDIAITERGASQSDDHPSTAMLVVEVADLTLNLDRRKRGLYAGAGIPEYWILNLPDRLLEVYRDPIGDSAEEFGVRYGHVQRLTPADTLTPLALPQSTLKVGTFLE